MVQNEYVLVQATDLAQKTTSRMYSHLEWGAEIMDQDTYVKREELLYNQSMTRDNLTIYLFGLKSEFEKNKKSCQYLCQLEEIRFDAFIKRRHTSHVQRVSSNSVCTVFCPVKNRGNGYATKMLQMYRDHLVANNVVLSTLYSDVGPKFYSKYGWEPHQLIQCEIKADASEILVNPKSVSLMSKFDALNISQFDVNLVKSEMEAMDNSDKTIISILPEYSHYEWRWARDDFEGKKCLGVTESASVFGAYINNGGYCDSSDTLNSFVVWTQRYREDCIMILRARFNSTSDAKLLLNAAIKEAHYWKLPKVVLWNVDDSTSSLIKSSYDSQFIEMKTSLPSVFLSNRAHDEKIHWIYSENYAWI